MKKLVAIESEFPESTPVNIVSPIAIDGLKSLSYDVGEMRHQMEAMATAILKIESYVCEMAKAKSVKVTRRNRRGTKKPA